VKDSDDTAEWSLLNEATGENVKYLQPNGATDDLLPRTLPAAAAAEQEAARSPEYYTHVVMPEDTLQGICLRYKIKTHILKRFNQDLGDINLQSVKTLLIPAEHVRLRGKVIVPQVRSRDVELQLFKNDTGLGTIEARLYLDDHDWDAASAKIAWAEDNAWEAAQTRIRKKSDIVAKDGKVDQLRHVAATAVVIAEASVVATQAGTVQFGPVAVATPISAAVDGTATR
jgi:LysM repeat protein